MEVLWSTLKRKCSICVIASLPLMSQSAQPGPKPITSRPKKDSLRFITIDFHQRHEIIALM